MKRYRKAFIFIFIIAIGVFLNRKYQLSSYLTDPNNLKNISQMVEGNYLLAVFFYLLFTILGSSLLALPGVTFAVISTGLFGPWIGSLYCLVGTTIGATMSFLLSRYLLKDSVENLVKKNPRLYDIILETNSEKEFLILMITRLLPIFPFNLQNFAYGITNISLATYSFGTFLFMIPGIIIFSIATEGLINAESRNRMFVLGSVILILMVIIGKLLYKKYKKLTLGEGNER